VAIPQNREPFDRTPFFQRPILLRTRHAKQPPSLLLCRAKIPGPITTAPHRRKVRDPSALQSGLNFLVFFHRVLNRIALFIRRVRLHSLHFRPRDELLPVHIHHGFERLRLLHDHYKRFPAHRLPWLPRQHFFLRSLFQLNQGVSRLGVHFSRRL